MARRRAEMDQDAENDADYDSGDDWFLPSTVNRNMTLLTSSSSCLVTSTHNRTSGGGGAHGNNHHNSRARGVSREGGRPDPTQPEQQHLPISQQQQQQNTSADPRTPSQDDGSTRSEAVTSSATSSPSYSRAESTSSGVEPTDTRTSRASIVDDLLFDIYDRWHCRRYSYDSDTTYTEYSSTSEAVFYRSDSVQSAFDDKQSAQYQRKYLQTKDISELRQIRSELRHRVSKNSARLIRQLKNRDRHLVKASRNCDIITAILQASSLKRHVTGLIYITRF